MPISNRAVRIPIAEEPLVLPAPLWRLRNRALEHQPPPGFGPAGQLLIDAETWTAREAGEPWLVYRARQCAARLARMPLQLEPGELLVGRPLLTPRPEAGDPAAKAAHAALADRPPFPGGDTGHFHPDYESIFTLGLEGLRARVADLSARSEHAPEQQAFYRACDIALRGVHAYIGRVSEECAAMAERDPGRREQWTELAAMCGRLQSRPPATFHEALQCMFLWQIALWFGDDHPLTTPGRMDQTLIRFYEADMAAGRLTRAQAFELIACLYIQMNRILYKGSAISVMVGGRDSRGRYVANELTYLCLAARLATHLGYPTVAVAWHPDAPDALMDYSMELLATGIGDPAFFNDPLISDALRDHGVAGPDAYNYMNSTCVEIKPVGSANIWVTQPYICCPQALMDVLTAGARAESPAADFSSFRVLVQERLAEQIAAAAQDMAERWRRREEHGGFPLASCVIRDCLERGRDFDRGGARYNWVENAFVGFANLVDSLLTVKHLVYERQELTLTALCAVLACDFEGHAGLRQRILNTIPKYGNDDAEADALARELAEFLIRETESHRVGPHRYVPGFFCWIQHERLGALVGATPDGRRAGLPFADGAGAAQGREKAGVTASLLSTTSWSHRAVLGGLVHNARFSPGMLRSRSGRQALRRAIEVYLQRGGMEIQINAIGTEDLRRAQQHPEQHPDLLVRVAGYSDYFVHLTRKMQDEIIQRTEFSQC